MSEKTLGVATKLSSQGEVLEAFALRVDDGRILLPSTEAVSEGESFSFEICLVNGEVVLAGEGVCVEVYDNESEPDESSEPYDLLVEIRALTPESETFFGLLLDRREAIEAEEAEAGDDALSEETITATSGELSSEEVSLDEFESVEQEAHEGAASAMPLEVDIPHTAEGDGEEDSMEIGSGAFEVVGEESGAFAAGLEETQLSGQWSGGERTDETDLAALAIETEPGVDEAGAHAESPQVFAAAPHAMAASVLSRSSRPWRWQPVPSEQVVREATEALFHFPEGLPSPSLPPRPELAGLSSVSPAPRQGGAESASASSDEALSGDSVSMELDGVDLDGVELEVAGIDGGEFDGSVAGDAEGEGEAQSELLPVNDGGSELGPEAEVLEDEGDLEL